MVHKATLSRNIFNLDYFFHLGNFASGCYYNDIYYDYSTSYAICITHTYVCTHTGMTSSPF